MAVTSMGFSDYRGNTNVAQTLRGMVSRNRLPHSLIFAGPEGVGKYTLALMLAKAIHCSQASRLRGEQGEIDFCGACANCHSLDSVSDRRAAVAKAEEDQIGRAHV